jgi:hypothetical protein
MEEDAGGLRPFHEVAHGFCHLLDGFSVILNTYILIFNTLETWRDYGPIQ